MTNRNSDSGQGSFLTGFTVGLFAGAAGLFLFGTKDGEKVRRSLNQEWKQAKEKLAEDGVIENKDQTLREIVEGVFKKIQGEMQSSTHQPNKTSRSKKTPTKKKKTLKFSGV